MYHLRLRGTLEQVFWFVRLCQETDFNERERERNLHHEVFIFFYFPGVLFFYNRELETNLYPKADKKYE